MSGRLSILFRVIDRNPAHVRVGVWAGRQIGSRGKSGELVFRTDEWVAIRDLLLFVRVDLGERTPLIDIESGEGTAYDRQDSAEEKAL